MIQHAHRYQRGADREHPAGQQQRPGQALERVEARQIGQRPVIERLAGRVVGQQHQKQPDDDAHEQAGGGDRFSLHDGA